MTITRYANVPTADLIREAENSPDEMAQELAKRCRTFWQNEWHKAYEQGFEDGLYDRKTAHGPI